MKNLIYKISKAIIFLFFTANCSGAAAYVPNEFQSGEINADSYSSLSPGDIFEVKVYQEPDLSGVFQVSSSGTIDFPLVGTIKVEGLTSEQIAGRLRNELREKYIKDPYVSVFIKEFTTRKIHILGQVNKPGSYKYEDNMSIIQAIALAGGFTKMARQNNIIVTRVEEGVEKRIVVPVEDISSGLKKNMFLKPGDIIYVPETIL
ncbi:MAG: polysaccharide export protein [Deltaproteobacteria bacterium]|nr:polysaccharide export protein [Deltaproteobacteria bacterium]